MSVEVIDSISPSFSLKSRRYIGNKTRLLDWIHENVTTSCKGSSFMDLFAGTGVVSERFLGDYSSIVINDFLYSNRVIYEAFFCSNENALSEAKEVVNNVCNSATMNTAQNYFSKNFGGKFFGKNDARIIGDIRQQIEEMHINKIISDKVFYILLASLIYSMDRISNTVGHYDAYIKKNVIDNRFTYGLISPIDTQGHKISIYQEDANELIKKIKTDVVFIDPPYNSRQYSRFYHVLENVAKWKKPKLFGTALKPAPEHMSDYCRSNAPCVFDGLISNLQCKYIVVTYNNTFNSKSSSSMNKITLEQIEEILKKKGVTKVLSKDYRFFNSGKTQLDNHKEYLFITEVGK